MMEFLGNKARHSNLVEKARHVLYCTEAQFGIGLTWFTGLMYSFLRYCH